MFFNGYLVVWLYMVVWQLSGCLMVIWLSVGYLYFSFIWMFDRLYASPRGICVFESYLEVCYLSDDCPVGFFLLLFFGHFYTISQLQIDYCYFHIFVSMNWTTCMHLPTVYLTQARTFLCNPISCLVCFVFFHLILFTMDVWLRAIWVFAARCIIYRRSKLSVRSFFRDNLISDLMCCVPIKPSLWLIGAKKMSSIFFNTFQDRLWGPCKLSHSKQTRKTDNHYYHQHNHHNHHRHHHK